MIKGMTRMKVLTLTLLLASSCVAPSCVAQTTQPTAPEMPAPTQPAAGPTDIETNDLLDAMEKVGVELKSLRADLAMKESDSGTGAESIRTGTITMQRRAEGDTRGHVVFDKLETDGRRIREKVEYLLDGDWVIDRVYPRPGSSAEPRETHRQVRRAGDKTDLLKLGDGPLPLPIGQPRDVVKAEFEVTRLPDDAEKPGLVGLELRPKPTNRLSTRFHMLTVWVDPTDAMPRVVQTMSPNQNEMRETALTNVRLNEGVTDADFVLEPIDPAVWKIVKEPLTE
jgi:hypothetical protein